MFYCVSTSLIYFFGFHDGGVGEGTLMSWLGFFLFVDARLILSTDNISRHLAVFAAHTVVEELLGKVDGIPGG